MHRTARLLFCRFAFFALCLAPTALLFAWSLSERGRHVTPDDLEEARQRIAAELSRQLGLTVSLAGVSYPEGHVTLLEGLELSDPETGHSIARLGHVEMALSDRGLALLASQVELELSRLEALWEPLHDRLLRGRIPLDHNVRLTASQATLRDGDESQTVTDLALSVRLAQRTAEATIEFRLAGLDMPEPARLRIVRGREQETPQTRWELHTGAVPLPCGFFARQAPWLSAWGERCHVHGLLWATRTPEGWDGALTGILDQVDLDRLVSDHFPHKLTGLAKVHFTRLRLEQGRLTEAAGWLVAGPGIASRSLLDAACAEQGLRLAATERLRESDGPLLRYRRLAFGFTLDTSGLSLVGQCDGAPAGALLMDDRGALLLEPPAQLLPTLGLVRTLVPDSEAQAPMTRETALLLKILALPTTEATVSASRKLKYHSLRLKE